MKAVIVREFGDASKCILENDVQKPKPADDEVLIKVNAAGVNPVDLYILKGPGTHEGFAKLPYTPGLDAAGTIEEVGSKVTEFKKGDRVFATFTVSGGYAEYTTAKALHTTPLDSKLSFVEGAAIGVAFTTAYRAIHTIGRAKPGETVLVHGASGAVGLGLVQMTKAFGLRVLGTAGTKEGLELIKSVGADEVFNHREKGYQDQILRATGGQGVNTVYEMLANINLESDLKMLRKHGKIVLIGSRGSLDFNPEQILLKEATVLGVQLYFSTEEDWEEMKAAIVAGQSLGWLKPAVARTYSLNEVRTALNDVMVNKGSAGKLVLDLQKR